MLLQLGAGARNPVLGGIIAAAVERPVVGSQSSADNSGAKLSHCTAQRDIGLAFTEVAEVLAVVELDHDLRMALVELAKHRREERYENLLGRDPHSSARVALLGCCRLGERISGDFDMPGALDQLIAGGRQGITGLSLLEQRKTNRAFQGCDPSG